MTLQIADHALEVDPVLVVRVLLLQTVARVVSSPTSGIAAQPLLLGVPVAFQGPVTVVIVVLDVVRVVAAVLGDWNWKEKTKDC